MHPSASNVHCRIKDWYQECLFPPPCVTVSSPPFGFNLVWAPVLHRELTVVTSVLHVSALQQRSEIPDILLSLLYTLMFLLKYHSTLQSAFGNGVLCENCNFRSGSQVFKNPVQYHAWTSWWTQALSKPIFPEGTWNNPMWWSSGSIQVGLSSASSIWLCYCDRGMEGSRPLLRLCHVKSVTCLYQDYCVTQSQMVNVASSCC